MVMSTTTTPTEASREFDGLPHLNIDACPEDGSAWQSRLVTFLLSPAGQRLQAWLLSVVRVVLVSPWSALHRILRPHRPLPPLTDPLLQRSAKDLARLIRTQQVRSEQVVWAFAERVRAVNPFINAVVDERLDAALEDARRADALVAAAANDPQSLERLAREKPLLGVPLTAKESHAVKGLSHTAGQKALRGRLAQEDSEAVRRLRGAGAIPLLVSNCPELCMFYETYNCRDGTTRNPHDTRRTPGGSSGGEAALLGAGASVIGLASDLGGSARLPAMFTGVFGYKPTPDMISESGHIPSPTDLDWWRLFTVGPMTRYAEDLPLMMKIICKEEYLPILKLDEKVNLSKLRIFYLEADGGSVTKPPSPDVLSGMHKALDHLQTTYKVTPEKIYIKELEDVYMITTVMLFRLKGFGAIYPDEWGNMPLHWLKFWIGMDRPTLYTMLHGPLSLLFSYIPKERISHICETIGKIKTQIEEILKDDGVLLIPTFHKPAPFHREMFFEFPNAAYASVFNLAQLPATHCPVGKSKEGLPIGIQIAASRYQDRLTLAVAKELENGLGGWVRP